MSIDWTDEAKQDLKTLGLRRAEEVQNEALTLDGIAWYRRDRDPDTYRYVCDDRDFYILYWRVGDEVLVLSITPCRSRFSKN